MSLGHVEFGRVGEKKVDTAVNYIDVAQAIRRLGLSDYIEAALEDAQINPDETGYVVRDRIDPTIADYCKRGGIRSIDDVDERVLLSLKGVIDYVIENARRI